MGITAENHYSQIVTEVHLESVGVDIAKNDLLVNENAVAETPPSSGYEYTHADGSIHRAETTEKAREICPVLGKMATEQANLLLEIAAIGQEKLRERPVADKAENEHDMPKSTPKTTEETTPTSPEPRSYTDGQELEEHIDQTKVLETDASTPMPPTHILSPNYDADPVSELTNNAVVAEFHEARTQEAPASQEAPFDVQSLTTADSGSLPYDVLATIKPTEDIDRGDSSDLQAAEIVDHVSVNGTEPFQVSPISSQESTVATFPEQQAPQQENLYEEFVATFEDLILQYSEAASQAIINEQEEIDTEPIAQHDYPKEFVLAAAIGTRLDEMTMHEREIIILPRIEEVVKSIQHIKTLEISESAHEVIEAARANLSEAVTNLLEELHIEHSPESVAGLSVILLALDVAHLLPNEFDEPTGEDEGTHEVKRSIAHLLAGSLDDIQSSIVTSMGKFVVYQLSRYRLPFQHSISN